tara:strand:+ start:2284 stop:2631 length:348 start_codon:yes stop_codon:yes gene_type:complete
MKGIFKIEEYLPTTNQIVVKFSRLHSTKPIDEHRSIVIDCSRLDLYDCETFVESLMRSSGTSHIIKQEDKEPCLDENIPEIITGDLNIQDLVGKVIGCKTEDYRKAFLKMRRVEL